MQPSPSAETLKPLAPRFLRGKVGIGASSDFAGRRARLHELPALEDSGFLPVLRSPSTEKETHVPARAPHGISLAESLIRARTPSSFLDEGTLDDVVAGRRMIALDETAFVQNGAQIVEHRGAAAKHHAVVLAIERRQAEILGECVRGDEIGEAAAIAERLARHGRVINELAAHEVTEEFVIRQLAL